jgi:hypothetical protein
MKDNNGQPLAGGNVSSVMRFGKEVHRNTDWWSPAVHGLLQHLEALGFQGAPRFLGLDERGREILSFIEGEVGNDPVPPRWWADSVVIEVARLMRNFHDATTGYVSQVPYNRWQFPYPDPTQYEVICHNDIAPYNTVFVNDKPVAFIDFDTAGPGPRIWDIAYALYRFIPLSRFSPNGDGDLVPYDSLRDRRARKRRIQLFCDSYDFKSRDELTGTIKRRLEAMCQLLIQKAAEGVPAYQRMVEEGHLLHYQKELEFLREYQNEWFDSI